MINKNKNKILMILLVLTLILGLVGCSKKKITSPEDAIKDAYGNTQFRISFDSTDLESPLADMYYTASNMPILPTPVKVGYVFAGWYFDSSLTKPCDVDSGDLLWKMKNLTLYPKWEEEKIHNNGTYEIEFSAKIKENTISMGPLASTYQEFPNDIVKNETYIEKNEKGTFLRIQYDNVVRGPVLGSNGADPESNFSKMTYTVTDRDNRINKDISILDRTNTIQTIYYDISDLNIADPITLTIEYYNWKANLSDDLRPKASVLYEVEFRITRFIGFNQSFVNPEGRLENGIYVVPTHYADLSKSPTLLDAFNPVYAYIEAVNGRYRLYKPLNTYNNDFPNITPEQYPLRTSGYAREFACFHIDQDLTVSKDIEGDFTGKYYIPEELKAKSYQPITYEFHADTGKYFYSIDLGEDLTKDLVFIGGSAGAMEQMFSFPFDYRRLLIDYKSMVRIVDWDYEPLLGNEYTYHEKVAFYPGSNIDFNTSNNDFDVYQNYLQAINMVNCFFTETRNGNKVYDTKMVISPERRYYPMGERYQYATFDIQYSAYGYNPLKDGTLLARDLSFNTNTAYRFANSSVNKKYNGLTCKIGDQINLNKVYNDKVSPITPEKLTYKAYRVDNNLKVLTEEEIKLNSTFTFNENVAVLFEISDELYTKTSLVYIMEKEDKALQIIDPENNWVLDNGIYTTSRRYKIGPNGDEITAPEVRYKLYGESFTTSGLKKYDEDDVTFTDFRVVSVWEYNSGKYKSKYISPGEKFDFKMPSEKVRVMMQLVNPFSEFETILFEYRGEESGEYEIRQNGLIISAGDIKYKGRIREKITFDFIDTIDLYEEADLESIPEGLKLNLIQTSGDELLDLAFTNATVYLSGITVNLTSKDEIWNLIKNEKYAVILISYETSYGDIVTLKAQYNFLLDAKEAKGYKFLNDSVTIFNYSDYEFAKPILMTNEYNKVHRGRMDIFKKNGLNYERADENDLRSYSDEYAGNVKFYKCGTYLIQLEYDLYKDETGKFLFDYYTNDPYAHLIKISICQEVTVIDKNSDMKITFATDKAHPFNQESPELEGYTFSEDENYQYATVIITKDKKFFAPTQRAFILPSDLKEKLFVWSKDNHDETLRPGFWITDLSVKTGTLDLTLYAWWDPGVKVPVYVDNYGDVTMTGKIYLERDPYTGGGYIVFFSHLAQIVSVPKGYVLYGWKASKPIFQSNDFQKGGYEGSVEIYEEISFTAVLKKKASIVYEAVDASGKKLEFMKPLRPEFDVFVKDNLYNSLKAEKIKELNKVTVTNASLKFSHWEVYDYELQQYVEINLETFNLDEKYCNEASRYTLRAVFK